MALLVIRASRDGVSMILTEDELIGNISSKIGEWDRAAVV